MAGEAKKKKNSFPKKRIWEAVCGTGEGAKGCALREKR